MRILNLHVENIKQIKVVDITPKEDIVVIEGKNAAGKTSVLDSIAYLFGGQKLIPRDALAYGKDKGTIEADIGAYRVSRVWTAPDKNHLKIETKEGARPNAPQGILDDLIGPIMFDPLRFMAMDWEKQAQVIRDITGLDIDDLEMEYQTLYDKRRVVNRDLDRVTKELLAFRDLPPKSEIPDRKKLQQDISGMTERNLERKRAEEQIAANESQKAYATEQIVELERKIKQLRENIAQHDRIIEGLRAKANEEREDTTVLAKQLAEADKAAELLYKHERRDELMKSKEGYDKDVVGLQKKMDDNKVERERMVAEAKMPITGLEVRADGVYYNGVEMHQISSAEQWKVSVSIGMAQNPKLRVILIRDGSLLDADSKKVLRDMARENRFQIWIEQVADKKGNEMYIEEGELK